MSGVVWRRLTLTGFGRFADSVTVELGPGVNVLVAPNERGKSTIMAGLAATLFGLPAVSDESQFGQAKYRNWGKPLRFEGELEFSRNGADYKVWRDFDTHRVKVSSRTAAGWKDVVTGEHNPRARRPNKGYESFLQEAVGVETVELFRSVFAFGSPLPEAADLDEHVQRLVSGAGSAHYGAALKQLVETVAELTKSLKAAGVASRDRHKDGELERLQRQERELRERLQADRAAVDELQQVQRRLNELTAAGQEAEGEAKAAEAALEAWTEWQQVRTERRRALQEQSQVQRTWEEYRDLGREAERERARVGAEYPEFVDADADAGDKLRRLQELEAALEARRTRRRGEIAAAVARAEEKLAGWRGFVQRREKWRALRRELTVRFSPFESADEATRRLYARFETERERLRAAVERARQRLAAAEQAEARRQAARARLESERQSFLDQYGDLNALDDDGAAAAIAARLDKLRLRDELTAQQLSLYAAQAAAAREGRAMSIGGAAAGVLAAGLLAFVLWRSAGPAWAAAAGVLAAAAAAYWSLAVLPKRARLAATTGTEGTEHVDFRLAEVEEALASDPRLGPFADADAHELGALQQRLAARRRARQALAEAEAAAVELGGDVEAAARATAKAEAEERALFERLSPGLAAFGEEGLAEAFGTWRMMTSEAERTEAELRRWVEERFGAAGLEPEEVRLRPEDSPGGRIAGSGGPAAFWLELARIALAADGDGSQAEISAADLVERLSSWTGEEAERVADAVSAAESKGDSGPDAAERARLRHELAPLLAPVDGDGAKAAVRWQEYKDELARIARLKDRQAGLLSGYGVKNEDELHVRIVDLGNRAEAARRTLEQLSGRHPGLPDPDGADDDRLVVDRLQQLERRRDEARAAAAAAEAEYRSLLAKEAALGAVQTLNIAAAELELQRLGERLREVEFEIAATALACQELGRAAEEYEQTHRDVLAAKATDYLRRFTGRNRDVVIDEQFHVVIQDPDGPRHGVGLLSQGARDQLYMALRLAIADLVAGEAPLPLLLDDPFVHCDGERRRRIREAMRSLAGGRQTVLFSHRDEFRGWGHTVEPQGEGWDGG